MVYWGADCAISSLPDNSTCRTHIEIKRKLLHARKQAENSNNLASVVEKPGTMLTPDRVHRVGRELFAVRQYLVLE